jgi:hypothetical protein
MKTNHTERSDDFPLVDEGVRAVRAEAIPKGPPRAVVDAILEAGRAKRLDVRTPEVARGSRVSGLSRLALGAAVLLAVGAGIFWYAVDGNHGIALAAALEKARNAESATWKTEIYSHKFNKDETYRWRSTGLEICSFKAPGRYRIVGYGDDGQPWRVVTDDQVRGIRLELRLASKTATLKHYGAMPESRLKQANVCGRLGLLQKELTWDPKPKPLGKREMDGHHVVGFRVVLFPDDKADIWIDAKTGTIVRYYSPSADLYDSENDPAAKNKPLDSYYGEAIKGSVKKDIVWDAPMDDELFSVTPPPGYQVTVIKRREVTEKDFLHWLGIVARYNKHTFPDEPTLPADIDEVVALEAKPAEQRTPEETKILRSLGCIPGREETEHGRPLSRFILFTAVDTWHYQGQGVILGDADAVICWYRPKGAKDFRVVYGDLSVRDIPREQLPIKRR